ncbi:hypothetical protein [Mycoplasma struthionis]|uniref:DUF3196 domain-containing protein n=1 Tax=Mycoplasma struthionis TaxID=538220 RepID=A0A3G8LJ90_9MOLU|nr:hypothetical protein [Mycoplasma struthionis]AZG68930.1 hypothetical protein EGN60_03200 [Mycoplasma struthionis]TPI01170.1 hypothetical protein FJM01_03075 [Mycoplasma struthionis]
MNAEKELENLFIKIQEIRNEDPLKAIYLIDESKKQFIAQAEINELDALRRNIEYQIKKQNLIVKTSLDTISLINSLKNKKMDYVFMLIYNELKNRDLKEYASEFQYFFNGNDFDNKGFQTLIYDLLQKKEIDYDYKISEYIINPKKLGAIDENKEIKRIQNEILSHFEKDIAKSKTASQVFAAYVFQNWLEIINQKTQNDYQIIIDVIDTLLGQKDANELQNEAKKLYEFFKK